MHALSTVQYALKNHSPYIHRRTPSIDEWRVQHKHFEYMEPSLCSRRGSHALRYEQHARGGAVGQDREIERECVYVCVCTRAPSILNIEVQEQACTLNVLRRRSRFRNSR